MEINDLKWPQPIWDFFQAIAIPRCLGTSGATNVRQRIEKEFTALKQINPQIHVSKNTFSLNKWYVNGILTFFFPIIGIFIIIAIICNFTAFTWGSLTLSLVIIILSLFHRPIQHYLKYRIQIFGKQYGAMNLITEIPPKDSTPLKTVVLLAHTDSISHFLPPILQGIGFLMSYLGSIVFGIHCFIFNILGLLPQISPSLNSYHLLWGFIIVGFSFLELINIKRNKSAGVLDDASGVAALYVLGDHFAHYPLNQTHLYFVATGAEEWGDYGAYYFCAEFQDKLLKDSTYFLILDGIGSAKSGTNQIIYGTSCPNHHFSKDLETLARHLIDIEKIDLSMMAIPPLIHFSSDHMPVTFFGYQCLLIGSSDFRIHSTKDTWSLISESMFTTEIMWLTKFLEEIDQQIPLSNGTSIQGENS